MKKIVVLLGLLCSSMVLAKPCCPIRIINGSNTDLTVRGTFFDGNPVEPFTLPAGQYYFQLETVRTCGWTSEVCREAGAFLYISNSKGDYEFVGEVPNAGAVIIKGTGMIKGWSDYNRFTPYMK